MAYLIRIVLKENCRFDRTFLDVFMEPSFVKFNTECYININDKVTKEDCYVTVRRLKQLSWLPRWVTGIHILEMKMLDDVTSTITGI
jgi:hypothetical protein